MKPKIKALLYNFVCFAVLFLIARILLGYFLPINPIFMAVTAAIIANVLAPKFGVINVEGEEKMMVKWIFMKEIREIK